MSLDHNASYYEEVVPRIEQRPDGSTHVYVGSAKVRDDAPSAADGGTRSAYDAAATTAVEIADPRRPASGQQPDESGFKTLDFRRSSDGRWRARDARGRVWRLRVNGDNSVFRVSPEEEDRPWSVRMRQGDRALAEPARPLSAEQESAGLARWQQRLSDFWKRKDTGEAA